MCRPRQLSHSMRTVGFLVLLVNLIRGVAGKQLDDQDARAEGLLHLIELLAILKEPPFYIFLENVVNFEKSRSRDLLVSQLVRLGYEYSEWLLSPLQFGIPNDRMRYYLTARRTGTTKEVESPPVLNLRTTWPYENYQGPQPLADFLEDDPTGNIADIYAVPEPFVRRRRAFSEAAIVTPFSTRSSCFTKAYGHHGLGAGSFLQTKGFDGAKYLDDPSTAVEKLGLRFFTPTEIARLHAFPIDDQAPKPSNSYASDVTSQRQHSFAFPPDLSTIQRWRVLGNSMNCKVVGELMRWALFGNGEPDRCV
ncbi:hypothetical protein, variant [Spizellomyces punctatus DAOM BR117]|uniref:DNA (Cytosine-5-)-methyltransferase n=1 Tax=Spizellomyces punctatus (strain DAOM BR117) TaxID=645134 RepID=A0A0L0HNN0_SPIPD|nr:hypothetical protein, variant [Spizellomyces punctatus DAOM BR117]KND02682.1 hypothetical protein, variant [Spizellomyces punctatus DAOM BR117]|eukprot:XP_016610721.1 hypothetical protein, variant [Spizellomyces punctatus DAOM BR117]